MPEFEGFHPQDFGDLAGSTWRGRKSLGGFLARALRHQLAQPYESWGVRRRLELHLAYRHVYNYYNAFAHAKLFVCTYNHLAFGFYIETPPPDNPNHNIADFAHWRRFRDQLQTNSAMQTALLSAMVNHDLVVMDFYRRIADGALGCQFRASGGRIQRRDGDESPWVDAHPHAIFRRLAQLPEDKWVDLHICTTIKRQEAIEMGPRVTGSILRVLRALAPIYDMTVVG